MAAIEFWNARSNFRYVELEAPRYFIGSDPALADISVNDSTVSGLHVCVERVGTAWLVRDIGSRNGTKVNGRDLTMQHRLRDRDEVLFGRTRFIFREAVDAPRRVTDALTEAPPDLTPGERRVLKELCRPLLQFNSLHEPASVREIGMRLHMTKSGGEKALERLYDKFGIHRTPGVNRRLALAREAIARGAVTIRDIQPPPEQRPRG